MCLNIITKVYDTPQMTGPHLGWKTLKANPDGIPFPSHRSAGWNYELGVWKKDPNRHAMTGGDLLHRDTCTDPTLYLLQREPGAIKDYPYGFHIWKNREDAVECTKRGSYGLQVFPALYTGIMALGFQDATLRGCGPASSQLPVIVARCICVLDPKSVPLQNP